MYSGYSKNIPKFEKSNFEKKILSTHMRFSIFDKCYIHQNHTENLAFATRASHDVEKYLKNQNFSFSKILGDRSLRLQLPRGKGSVRMLPTQDLPWAKFMLHNSNDQISRNRFRSIARE